MTDLDKLDRSSPLPLWAQLLTNLRERISDGEFRDRFPTDLELVDAYGVSRHTVREAVRRIQAEGILDRRRGRGTFVRQEFEQPLGSIYSLFRSVEATGVEQTSVVLTQDRRIEPDVAANLGLSDAEEFFYLERLRLAGEDVLAIDRVWVPFRIAEPLLEADFTKTALYNELRDRCGVSPEAGTERIRPVLPTAEERADLGLSAVDAAFLIERQTQTESGPLEYRETLVRGDRYRFAVEWMPGHSDGLPQLEPERSVDPNS
ncbi:MAG: GntR family transcriptional regulator [Acidimicrobiia bacterium]|nr:GntR family transcriptional regulator [Acidimicrobiia bacterium]